MQLNEMPDAVNIRRQGVLGMDETTRQVLKAFQHSVELQLKPIQDRQEEILNEVRFIRREHQSFETKTTLLEHRVSGAETDLNKALSAIRREFTEKIGDANKTYAPLLASIPGIVAILIAIYFSWLGK